jgi:hypothetical protein
MPEKKKRTYRLDTDTLPDMQIKLAARLDPQQHRAFIQMMERTGLNEHQRRDLLDRLIEQIKRI